MSCGIVLYGMVWYGGVVWVGWGGVGGVEWGGVKWSVVWWRSPKSTCIMLFVLLNGVAGSSWRLQSCWPRLAPNTINAVILCSTAVLFASQKEQRLYRFATYSSAKITTLQLEEKEVQIAMEDRQFRLHMQIHRSLGTSAGSQALFAGHGTLLGLGMFAYCS